MTWLFVGDEFLLLGPELIHPVVQYKAGWILGLVNLEENALNYWSFLNFLIYPQLSWFPQGSTFGSEAGGLVGSNWLSETITHLN